MTPQEAIEQLRFGQSMILFNPTTGEEQSLKDVKLFNEENYKTYLADELAISALEKQIPVQPPISYGVSVKALDIEESKICTYSCCPCPKCGKWIVRNKSRKY